MNNIKKEYNDFLDDNYIENYDQLRNKLQNYPFYCNITVIKDTNFCQINLSNKTLDVDENKIMKYFNNFIINIYNIYDFYYFGNFEFYYNDNILSSNLTKYNMKLYNDSIDFNIFYSNKWIITVKNYSNINDINEKKKFEKYTLYQLIIKYMNIFQINVNNLNKEYNYTFQLITNDTNLIIHNNISKPSINIKSIISKKNNKNIKITKEVIKNISNYILYNTFIYFNSFNEMKKSINNNYNLHYILIEKSDDNNIIRLEYEKFKEKKYELQEFINQPLYQIIDLKIQNKLNYFKNLFPNLQIYVNDVNLLLENIVNYYLKMYRDEKVLKKNNLVYKKYDKEIIYKIHGEYLKYSITITKNDILRILKKLKNDKLNYLLYRLY